MTWYWLVIIFILLLIEAVTMNLVTIWFALGAFFAFLISFLTDSIIIQLVIFIIISTISLLLTRNITKKIKSDYEKTNYDSIIGKIAIVTAEISENNYGRVTIDGKNWMAKSDKKIEKDKKVKVLSIEGAKLIVEEKER